MAAPRWKTSVEVSVTAQFVADAVSQESGAKLEYCLGAMVEPHDGFRLAEYDLSLRGPGDVLVARQAGVPRLRFGDLTQHTELLLEARGFAEQILDEDPGLVQPQHGALRRAIDRRFAHHVYGAESG